MRHRLLIPGLLVIAAAVMPAGASAAAPDFKDRWHEQFVDEDFCGTGYDVAVDDRGVAQGYDGATVFRVTFSARTTFTYDGKTVISQNVGRILSTSLDAPFDEPHTEVVDESGIRSKARIPGQGVVTTDHGLLSYTVTFVPNPDYPGPGQEPLMISDVTVTKDAGGHPDFYDFVWCEAITSYFGIPFEPPEP